MRWSHIHKNNSSLKLDTLEKEYSNKSMEQKRDLINRSKYVQLFFFTDTKSIHWKKGSLFNKWHWSSWISTGQNKIKQNKTKQEH